MIGKVSKASASRACRSEAKILWFHTQSSSCDARLTYFTPISVGAVRISAASLSFSVLAHLTASKVALVACDGPRSVKTQFVMQYLLCGSQKRESTVLHNNHPMVSRRAEHIIKSQLTPPAVEAAASTSTAKATGKVSRTARAAAPS